MFYYYVSNMDNTLGRIYKCKRDDFEKAMKNSPFKQYANGGLFLTLYPEDPYEKVIQIQSKKLVYIIEKMDKLNYNNSLFDIKGKIYFKIKYNLNEDENYTVTDSAMITLFRKLFMDENNFKESFLKNNKSVRLELIKMIDCLDYKLKKEAHLTKYGINENESKRRRLLYNLLNDEEKLLVEAGENI